MVDISAIVPIAIFLLVGIIMYALFSKTKLVGENLFVQLFTALIIASIFVSFIGVRTYISTIIPWFAVLIVALFLILAIIGFVGKMEFMHKGIGIAFVIILVLVFLISGIFVFSGQLRPYFPWSSGEGGNLDVLQVTKWLYSGPVVGAIVLVIISAIVCWVLVKTK